MTSTTSGIRTFLIADVRGYTSFTQRHGDAAAGRLASVFAEIAREGVEAWGGTLVELRGDEALCVFSSARHALRAAVELADAFREATDDDPSLPLRVGFGLDAGEAVVGGDDLHGGGLNRAARLCACAGAGQILATDGVTHLAVQRARIGRGADLKSLGVAFGASLARAEVEALLAEDGGSSEMLGVYFGDGDQHIDHRSIQDHVGSRTSSDLLYKGAMRDTSNAIYTGTVIIEHGAHQCDAYQTNRNILLSDHARAQSVPNLEILTNDPTRCGHAASVGPVSDDELFYLMSRGIPEKEAERLIVFGFFAEVLDRVDIAEIREGLEDAIEQEIKRGER
jgi:Fe-S cluster assembly scaffold protein SufB